MFDARPKQWKLAAVPPVAFFGGAKPAMS